MVVVVEPSYRRSAWHDKLFQIGVLRWRKVLQIKQQRQSSSTIFLIQKLERERRKLEKKEKRGKQRIKKFTKTHKKINFYWKLLPEIDWLMKINNLVFFKWSCVNEYGLARLRMTKLVNKWNWSISEIDQ